MQEIGGIAAVKGAFEIGREGILAFAARTATVLVGMTPDDLIKSLAIGCRHILHVREIFQPTFDLQRCGPSLYQFLQVITAVHVFQGQQVTITYHFPTLCILKRELHAAELRTFPSVGTTAETILRSITEARVTDT